MSKISLSIAFHLWSSRKTKDEEEIQMIGMPTPLEFHVKLPELNGVKQQAHTTIPSCRWIAFDTLFFSATDILVYGYSIDYKYDQ